MKKTIRIGTRESRLAVIQAEIVASAIQKYDPKIIIELVKIKTTGDMILDKTLDKIGGKGLFVKELDAALQNEKVDICVHSYKDMPAEDNPELPVIAVSPREDARDVMILPVGVECLDYEKPVGCSSKRRQIQFNKIYPGQPVAPVRGNVITRLEKLDSGEYSALTLAAAGIIRLGLWKRCNRIFSPEEMLPSACQGILAIQGRRGEDHPYLEHYNNQDSGDISKAERAFIRRLGYGCGAPVGAYAEIKGNEIRLRGMIAIPSRGGKRRV
jgi:hydroxymethylbilane synthase